jgi:hypothetical protein
VARSLCSSTILFFIALPPLPASLRDKLPQLNRMRILEWVAGALILGWGGVAYSILRVSAFVPPQPPRMRHRFGGNYEMETCS